jgi:hypothetical protein
MRYFQAIVQVIWSQVISLNLFFLLISPVFAAKPTPAPASPSSFTSEADVDVHFKKQIPIYLQHDLGDVSIQGWSQDLIRIKLKKTVIADSEEIAVTDAAQFGMVSLETPTTIELRVGTPSGTDLLTKLRNRQKKKNVKVDLEIRAPLNLPLTVVMGAGKNLKIQQWKGAIKITGKQGNLELAKLRLTSSMNVNGPDCKISILDSEFNGSILAGNQKVELKSVKAVSEPVLVFAQNGDIELTDTAGDVQIRSVNGALHSKRHQGDLHAQTELGKVNLDSMSGEVDIQTQSGDIHYDFIRAGKIMEIKTKSGNIDLSGASDFSGDLNLQSVQGDVKTDFEVQTPKKPVDEYGPAIHGKIIGWVGQSKRSHLTAFTEKGSILFRKRMVEK